MTTAIRLTRDDFLSDRQGRTFADVFKDPELPIDEAIEFFNTPERQRRMEESEIHHDRAPLAGVVRELESLPGLNKFLGSDHGRRNQRLRQAIGVLVRMIMERRGWKKTGKKGSLGIRSRRVPGMPNHNTGGLAFWFLRAERYQLDQGDAYPSVRARCRNLESASRGRPASQKRTGSNGRANRGKERPPQQQKSK